VEGADRLTLKDGFSDDITTNDIIQSFDVIERVKHAFDTSQNLKTWSVVTIGNRDLLLIDL
jgi:hypothetical protein